MKKILPIVFLFVLAVCVLVLKYESTHRVSIPVIPKMIVPPNKEVVVEAYIRSRDITEMTGDTPVLGGTWYLSRIVIDTTSNTAQIAYEDGHIVGSGTVFYTYDQTTGVVSVNSFTKEQ